MKVNILPPQDIVTVDPFETVKVNIKPTISVEIKDSNKKRIDFEMNMRKALNGDLMIFDHKDIDIIVMTEKKKIVAFAKDLMSEVVYGAESRLMEHLRRSGVIEYDSIQGGNVYGSLEGKLHDSTERDSVKVAVYQISEWMKDELPYIEATKGHDENMEDAILDPNDKDSTELGEVPHAEEKGSIRDHNMFAPYLYGRYTY
ncbi:MAG: hypothetical protein GOVbin1807_110 [Prokaryotic dsDNA virus sp.]|mgnify:CR=1 FL=1|nr:MAG: hypothetical protein GOVbin1807_110 [Prokaryotic dsDNA virus sp.]|tara:strand:+ start:800 stop:1402 length:603 start_codon:yes stop_codon:yes gene_type:complete